MTATRHPLAVLIAIVLVTALLSSVLDPFEAAAAVMALVGFGAIGVLAGLRVAQR